MEKLNRRICVKLTELLLGKSYNEKCTRDVKVCYSLENIIDDVEKVLILILLFGAFGKLLECFVCYVVICLTRVYMGGVHMRTWFGCTFMTVGIHACAVMCGSNIDIKRAWVWVFSIVLILMICVAPIPSPQRPDYTGRTRRKIVSDILEDLAEDIIALTGCRKSWGEVELPDCLRYQEDEKKKDIE